MRGEGINMNYYIREIQTEKGVQRTAGIKARDDLESIFSQYGFQPILIEGIETRSMSNIQKIKAYKSIYKQWKKLFLSLTAGDVLYVQCPLIHHTTGVQHLMKKAQKRGIKAVVFIHDLEMIRGALAGQQKITTKIRTNLEEKGLVINADHVIAHNQNMIDFLASLGVDKKRQISLGIFDYLIPEKNRPGIRDSKKEDPLVIAGTLRPHKAKYVYNLPNDLSFNLYGTGYEGIENEKIKYYGSFPPDELPATMKGSFGVVWDGETTETCSGVYGEYLKINNPHKTSLYLAAGLPVAIWEEAALASFVRENKCGLVIRSIEDLRNIPHSIMDADYEEMKKNAERIGQRLQTGKYTEQAIMQTRK